MRAGRVVRRLNLQPQHAAGVELVDMLDPVMCENYVPSYAYAPRPVLPVCVSPMRALLVGTLPAASDRIIYCILAHILAFLLDLIATLQCSQHANDLDILFLRQQLRILQRKHAHPPRLARWEKLGLAVLAAKLTVVRRGARSRLDQVILLFKPRPC